MLCLQNGFARLFRITGQTCAAVKKVAVDDGGICFLSHSARLFLNLQTTERAIAYGEALYCHSINLNQESGDGHNHACRVNGCR